MPHLHHTTPHSSGVSTTTGNGTCNEDIPPAWRRWLVPQGHPSAHGHALSGTSSRSWSSRANLFSQPCSTGSPSNDTTSLSGHFDTCAVNCAPKADKSAAFALNAHCCTRGCKAPLNSFCMVRPLACEADEPNQKVPEKGGGLNEGEIRNKHRRFHVLRSDWGHPTCDRTKSLSELLIRLPIM